MRGSPSRQVPPVVPRRSRWTMHTPVSAMPKKVNASPRPPTGRKLDGSATNAQPSSDDRELLITTLLTSIPGWRAAWNEYIRLERPARKKYLAIRWSLGEHPKHEWRARERAARLDYFRDVAEALEKWHRWKVERSVLLATRRGRVKLMASSGKENGNEHRDCCEASASPGLGP